MVERYEIKEKKQPLLVVDLDGTLVKGNTFRIFVRCGLMHLASNAKYLKFIKILSLLALRKFRLISHRFLKFKIIPIIDESIKLKDRFIADTTPFLNKDVKALLETYNAQGYKVLLATAAADIYIPWIYDGEFQATVMSHNPGMVENHGEIKLHNVLKYARTHNLELRVVITDHYDDIPLLKYGAYNILVHPSDKTWAKLRNANVRIDRIIG